MKEFPILDTTATGARIRELRKQNKLTVEQVRDYLGLESTQSIYKWQRGECMPSIDNLYALSTLFETSVDGILRGSREEDELSSSFYCAPSGARFQRVRVSNPPGSGKDIAEGKGVHREVESEGSWIWGTY